MFIFQAEEEEARQAAERERKRKEKEARKQRRREELGEDYVSEEEEEEEEVEGEGEGEGEGEAPPTEAAEKPKGPSSILSTFFDDQDESKFWVSMVSRINLLYSWKFLYLEKVFAIFAPCFHDFFIL